MPKTFDKVPHDEAVTSAIAKIIREALTVRTREELGSACLTVAEGLTGSRFGFIGEINRHTGTLDEIAISNPEWEACRMPDQTDYGERQPISLEIHGIYDRVLLNGKGLFTNDPASHPDIIGTPAGHPPLRSFLGMPLIHAGTTIGMVGLGNRDGGYGPEQLEAMERLAPVIAQAILGIRTGANLHENGHLIGGILGSAMDAIISVGEDQRIRLVNPAAERMFEVDAADAIGKPLSMLLPERFRTDHEAHVRRFADTNSSTRRMGSLGGVIGLRSNGEEFPIEASISQVTLDGIKTLTVILRDISERKAAETSLEQMRSMLSEAQKIAHLGSFEYVATTQTTVWSEEEYHIYGLDPSGPSPEYADMLRRCIHPDDSALLHDVFMKALQDSTVYELEHRIVRPDGSVRWVYDRAHPYFDDQGNLLRYVGATLDVTERKQSEETLRQERAKLDSIMQATDVMLVLLDTDFNFVWVNLAYAQTCQMRPEELIGKNHFVLYPDAENEAIFRRVRDTGEAVFYKDKPFVFPDQPERGITYWDWSLKSVLVANGSVSGLVFSLRETTLHMKTVQALRTSEELLRLAAEATGFGSYDFDLRSRRLVWSAELYTILGLPSSTQTSEALFMSLVHPDDRPALERHLSPGKNPVTEDRCELEFRIIRPDGETRWMRDIGRIHFGGEADARIAVRVIGTVQDITGRKHASMALRASEERFRGLVEQAADGIFVSDAQGHYLDVNSAGAQLLGYTPTEICRLNIADVIASDEVARIPDEVAKFADGSVVRSEWRFRRKDGSFFAGEVLGRQLSDGRLQAIVRDITERKRIEAALHEADRRKDEFLATLAHELRNPLTPIRNAVEVLNLKGSQDPTAQAARNMIERQVVHMARLIDDLLDVSRITHGRLHLRREQVDLRAVLEQALVVSRPFTESTKRDLTVELPEEPIQLDADPVRLAQVFSNLLSNAFKYTDQGGRVSLRAILVGDEVAVMVEDNGIGIPREYLPHVFDMFSQLRVDAERSVSGLGIGLALARNLTEMHGGRIEAQSMGTGQGSTFTVWLPLAAASSQSTTSQTPMA